MELFVAAIIVSFNASLCVAQGVIFNLKGDIRLLASLRVNIFLVNPNIS